MPIVYTTLLSDKHFIAEFPTRNEALDYAATNESFEVATEDDVIIYASNDVWNYYGALSVWRDNGTCYWSLSERWNEQRKAIIPESLYNAIVAQIKTEGRSNLLH